MINTILYDIDGVIVDSHEYFSTKFSREFNVSYDKMRPFFESQFQDCLIGKADLKAELKEYLRVWGWNKSVDEFLDYWFESESTVNQQIIDSTVGLRSKGINCGIHTNNEKHRTNYLLNNLGLKDYFDFTFSSSDIKFKKPEKEFWQEVYSRLNSPDKKSVLIVDDDIENIKSAKEFGFSVHLYKEFNDYINKVKFL